MARNQAIQSVSLREMYVDEQALWKGATFFRTERRCPRCRVRMVTNGKGDFKCYKCDCHIHQDVSKLYAAGLDYNLHVHHKIVL